MADIPSTMVRWSVAAFSAANPTEVVAVSGVCSRVTRARAAAADAALAVIFELQDAGVLLVSMTVGFTESVAGIDPAGLDLGEYQPLIDGLLHLKRPLHSWPFEW
ncbi:hypothetical protein [Williamsia maris]|uniref:Uncharacterized protein n=1 Tax=Williamsia maris TaxID=72806 RepID=A0ABT1HJA7_9NOCA|nr:hypothetical protein [Williamsia maris]MCP2178020.1 hypothetical protein [Williamsia maris]